jgi:hypothetical protein
MTPIPSVSVTYAQDGSSTRSNALGMRPMQELAYQKCGEPYLLIKSPPASGKSRALMFIALDKLANQGLKQAIVVVPERSIGGSRRFKNDTERLEKLFELYTQMTAEAPAAKKAARRTKGGGA